MNRGAFILFEGLDRCGKSTQSQNLTDFLKSRTGNCDLIKFPNRTSVIGGLINSYLASSADVNDNTIHLLFSANRWEGMTNIESKLLSGCNLVCDRYAHSGVAYSSSKGLDLEWCRQPDRGLIAPDCVIFLDLSVEDAAQRGSYGEERYEKIDFQKAVREKFRELQELDRGTIPWHVLDARKSIRELQSEIEEIAVNVVDDVRNKPLKRLWV